MHTHAALRNVRAAPVALVFLQVASVLWSQKCVLAKFATFTDLPSCLSPQPRQRTTTLSYRMTACPFFSSTVTMFTASLTQYFACFVLASPQQCR